MVQVYEGKCQEGHRCAPLKREISRIAFPPDFHAFARAGKHLMEVHIDSRSSPNTHSNKTEDQKAEVSFRVTRMVLNKKDRSELRYNDFLTLRGIPLDVYNYRFGNRSASSGSQAVSGPVPRHHRPPLRQHQ